MTEMNKKTRFFVIGVFVTTLFFISALRIQYLNIARVNADPIGSWVEYFVEKSYSSCDSLVSKKSDRLFAENLESYGTFEEGEQMYTTLLDLCVDSIEDIKVEMISKDEASVSVKVKPYKKVSKVSVDEEKLEAIKTKYFNGEMADSDLHMELKNIYSDSMKRTIGGSTKDAITVDLSLKADDGKVIGTHKALLDLLESTNMLDNLKVFEDEVSSTITVLLHK